MEIIFWSILAYGLALAFGLIGMANNKNKLLWVLFVAAIIAHGIYSYVQKTGEPPSRDEFNAALVQNKDDILLDIRQELNPPDFKRIKTIVAKRGVKFNDFLILLENGPPLEKGFKNLIQKQYDEAIELFEQNIILREDEAFKTWFFLGEARKGNKQYYKAIEAYRKALSFNPNHCLSWTMWGASLSKMHKFNEAITKHRKAIEVDSKCAQAFNNLGADLNYIGEFSQAVDSFKKAINLLDNDKKTNYQLAVIKTNWGISLDGLGKISEAKEYFQYAINNAPNLASAYQSLAIRTDFPEAEKLFQKALDLDPDFAEAYQAWGTRLMEQGQYDLAEKKLRKAIEKDAYFAEAYHNLGLILLRKATDKDPTLPKGFPKGFRDVLIDKDKALEAEILLTKAVELDPNNAAMNFTLGHVLRFLEKHEEAKKAYRKAIKLDPRYNMGATGASSYYPELMDM